MPASAPPSRRCSSSPKSPGRPSPDRRVSCLSATRLTPQVEVIPAEIAIDTGLVARQRNARKNAVACSAMPTILFVAGRENSGDLTIAWLRVVEELDHAGLERILRPDHAQPFVLDQRLEDLRAVL